MTAQQTEVSTQYTSIDQLNYFWTNSGVPCVVADRDNIEDIIENLGFNIYYLLCNVAEDKTSQTKTGTTTTTTTYTVLSTKIVKVTNNFVGRSVIEIKDEELMELAPVREAAEYNLPPIPRDIVDKLDEFFRLVHAQHGTESIVILTFDPAKSDSSGWGVLVPDQTNTSVHCKYDADSIVEQKPDDVLIVGSVHSHPEMAAYASGTDHADQADFDGIHITYGWQKSVNGGATQYHIEMQMSGYHWTLKPEDVFEDFTIKKDPDPQVLEWSKNVKKALPPKAGGYSTQSAATNPSTTLTPQDYTHTGHRTHATQNLPKIEEVSSYLIVAEIKWDDESDTICPSCHSLIYKSDLAKGNCYTCDIAICEDTSSYFQIMDSLREYFAKRKKAPVEAYYLWTKDDDDNDVLLKLATMDEQPDLKYSYNGSYDSTFDDRISILDSEFYKDYSPDNTVCCNTPVHKNECICPSKVLYDDLMAFESDHPYNVYEPYHNSLSPSCADCEHYYTRSCEPYHEAIMKYCVSGQSMETPISLCDKYEEYKISENYYDYS